MGLNWFFCCCCIIFPEDLQKQFQVVQDYYRNDVFCKLMMADAFLVVCYSAGFVSIFHRIGIWAGFGVIVNYRKPGYHLQSDDKFREATLTGLRGQEQSQG